MMPSEPTDHRSCPGPGTPPHADDAPGQLRGVGA